MLVVLHPGGNCGPVAAAAREWAARFGQRAAPRVVEPVSDPGF